LQLFAQQCGFDNVLLISANNYSVVVALL